MVSPYNGISKGGINSLVPQEIMNFMLLVDVGYSIEMRFPEMVHIHISQSGYSLVHVVSVAVMLLDVLE